MKLLCVFFFFLPLITFARTEVNLEAGLVRNPYNRAALPGDTGTPFSFSDSFDGSYFYHRLSLSHFLGEKQGVRFLYAPLRITGSETYGKDISFQGVNFSAGQKTQTEYQFNSYRASYFWRLRNDKKWDMRIGATLKVRDAKTKLAQGSTAKFVKNSGLVPLLYFFSEYKLSEKFRIAFDFDGMVAPQGRAIDAGIMAGHYIRDNVLLNLGYRILEGGVDNDKVYNFSRFDYVFSSLQINF